MFFLQASQKRLLSSLNPVFVVGLLLCTLVFRTTSKALLPTFMVDWDLLLPFAVYLGQRRTVVEGLILTLFLSHLVALCSSAPMGVFPIYYFVIFGIARLVSYVVYASSLVSVLSLMVILSILSRFILPLVAGFFDHAWPVFSWANLSLSGFVLNATLGVVFYVALELLDRLTYKAPRVNIELSETGL